MYCLKMTPHAQFIRHNPLQLQLHVVHHRVQALCASARKNLIALRIYFLQMTAHAQFIRSSSSLMSSTNEYRLSAHAQGT
jgi:hypothetical protein